MKLLWCLGTKPDPLAGLSHVVADNRFLQLAEDCAVGSGGFWGRSTVLAWGISGQLLYVKTRMLVL